MVVSDCATDTLHFLSLPFSPHTMKQVLLLKEEDEDYRDALAARGFPTVFIETLAFDFPLSDSDWRVRMCAPERFGGLIFTSPRAAQALELWMLSLPQDDGFLLGLRALWREKPIYVVGPKTSSVVSRVLQDPPNLITTKAGGKSAEALATEIVDLHHSQGLAASNLPLLFLCGSTRRQELVQILQSHRV